MKVKRMGKTEILNRIWLLSANKIKSSESVSKQPTQVIVELNTSLRYKIVTIVDVSRQQSYVLIWFALLFRSIIKEMSEKTEEGNN